jgi:hypothetical protein
LPKASRQKPRSGLGARGIGHDQDLAEIANGQQAVRGVLSYMLLALLAHARKTSL